MCVKLSIIDFESVNCKVQDIDPNILNRDQHYLLHISFDIKSGNFIVDLFVREPSPFSHSRWLTTADSVLSLYVSVETLSDKHKILVSCIIKSYMPVFFKIKKSKHLTDGSTHIFEVIQSETFLPENLVTVIDCVIERNTFFTHSENFWEDDSG